ncbi:hypothetical protein FS837_010142 [Tulasnella sp. UAMH 9824]|nr:hypothetical protein FS837_010142 [Tulasnella sp. UAMH 9824]
MKQPLQLMKTDPFTSPPRQSLKSKLKNSMVAFKRIKLQAPPINQTTGWQPPRARTPYPRRQRLSHVEITNLKQVLTDPEWAAVRTAYLLSQRLRKNASANSLRKKGKGKERAEFYLETSDESDEDEVNYVLGANRSPSRAWSNRSYSFGTRSPSASYANLASRYHKPRKEPRYTLFDRSGEMSTKLGMEDFKDGCLYVPSDDSEDRRARKARRLQQRRSLQEDVEEIGAEDYWRGDSGEMGEIPLTVTETAQRRGSSERITPLPKLRLTFHPRDSQSADCNPPKRPRKRKRRHDEVSESDGKPEEDDVSSSSEWAEDLESPAKPDEGEFLPDSLISISRNGKRVHSIWTNRGTQRNLRIFTKEEQARIEAECRPRWCHMCHKKKLTMACNGTKGRCGTTFCDHCLARYPLDFDPFSTFLCPRCDGTCICGACMKNRAKRGAKAAADESKPRRRAAPRTKLSKAERAEQKRLLEAVKNLQSEAELSDASCEDEAVPEPLPQSGEPNRGTTSTSSSPPLRSPPPQLPDQTKSITTIRWSTPSSLLATSPGIQSRSVEQEQPASPPPLPSFYSPVFVEDYSHIRSKASLSPARSLSPSSVGAASYFEKQIRLVDAKESVQKLKEARRKEIPAVAPFEMTSEQIFAWAEPFRREEPLQPLQHVQRRYKFPELGPTVGQTWADDVGMFAFHEEELSASKVASHPSSQQEAKDIGVSLGQLELRLSRSSSPPKGKLEFVDPTLNADSINDVLTCISNANAKVSPDPSVSEGHIRAASGSSEATDEMTLIGSTCSIISDEGDAGSICRV